jgi:hypothetical protein
MTEKKTQTILKLKQAIPYDMLAVLESIFFRSYSTDPMPDTHKLKHLRKEKIVVTSVDMAKKALDFMNHIRQRQNNGQPYHVKEWREYLSKNNLTVSTYESIKSRLLASGLLRQESRILRISSPTEFESILSKMLNAVQVWREYGR